MVTQDASGADQPAGSAEAIVFGLRVEINCRLRCALLRECGIDDDESNSTPVVGGLEWLSTIDNSYTLAFTHGQSPLEFVCCLLEHFSKVKSYMERYVLAKKCERIC